MEATPNPDDTANHGQNRVLFLGLGSNIGDRLLNLEQAGQMLTEKLGELVNASSIYETAPWGNTDQAAFLNQVIELATPHSPQDILSTCQSIEHCLHRQREQHWGPRTIDIDLLYLGDLTLRAPNLVLPHPWIASRRFVLQPLAEIAPNFIHPIHQMSSVDMLASCPDPLLVKFFAQSETS